MTKVSEEHVNKALKSACINPDDIVKTEGEIIKTQTEIWFCILKALKEKIKRM